MPGPVNQAPPTKVDGSRARLAFWLRHDAARLLWPGTCLLCDAPAGDGPDLCTACFEALPWLGVACAGCALPLSAEAGAPVRRVGGAEDVEGVEGGAEGPPRCGACLRGRSPLATVRAACVYAAPVDRLLPRFKFHDDLAAGALLAQLMAQAFADAPRPGALVPLPLHRARLRVRGYDQALELARPLARALDLPLAAGALVRTRATAPQSRLDADARRRNVRDAFAVRADAALPAHVALVDDVMTTGATLRAAAHALRRAGVARIDAWVCARVP